MSLQVANYLLILLSSSCLLLLLLQPAASELIKQTAPVAADGRLAQVARVKQQITPNQQQQQQQHQLSVPTSLERQLIDGLVHDWNSSAIRPTNQSEPRRALKSFSLNGSSAQLNYLGLDENQLESYLVQAANRSLAAVHLEPGQTFRAALIRLAFRESRANQAHVFLTSTKVDNIRWTPQDKRLGYSHRDVGCESLRTGELRVWSTASALDQFASQFGEICNISGQWQSRSKAQQPPPGINNERPRKPS